MNIIILGGDGYLGWPTAMNLANSNHKVCVVDDYSRRQLSKKNNSLPLFKNLDLLNRSFEFKKFFKKKIIVKIFDCRNYLKLNNLVKSFKPDAIIHYAEQPSAPYSMMGIREAKYTLQNNLDVTFNTIWSVWVSLASCDKISNLLLKSVSE